jgi:hypothetical protein
VVEVTNAGRAALPALLLAGMACGAASSEEPYVPPVIPPGTPVVLVGAGDIATCSNDADEATALLLDSLVQDTLPVVVFTAGDNAYPDGTAAQFRDCYHPTWGRHKARTRPAPGNHDYRTSGAVGYFGYFGGAAGDASRGYYSFDAGDGHVIVLNSEADMDAGSAQELWLRADLAASAKRCTVAIWHHPRWSSGSHHGNDTGPGPLWDALYDAGADLVINGHEHNYERFAPQTPAGAVDAARGLRQIVAGMGGRSHYEFGTPLATSEARNATDYGVLKVTIHADRYSWEFVPVAGGAFADSGTTACH